MSSLFDYQAREMRGWKNIPGETSSSLTDSVLHSRQENERECAMK
jgi:hypothetical protein